MNMLIDMKNSLKIFYYLIAIDNLIEDEEIEQFEQIGSELMGDKFDTVKNEILSECTFVLDSISSNENRYDVIIENLDKALSVKADSQENGIWPRFLLWNLLIIAYSDKDLSEYEKRYIDHVVRVLNIDKSVYTEMIQYINTSIAIQKELNEYEVSNRPYSEIKPLVDENEKRKATILNAAKELIEDEIIMIPEEKHKYEKKTNKIAEAMAVQGKKIGDAIAPAAKSVGKTASEGVKNLKSNAGTLLSKVKDTISDKTQKKS